MTGSSGAESTVIGDKWDGQSGHHGGIDLSQKRSYEWESEKQSAYMRPGDRVLKAKTGLCRDLGRNGLIRKYTHVTRRVSADGDRGVTGTGSSRMLTSALYSVNLDAKESCGPGFQQGYHSPWSKSGG